MVVTCAWISLTCRNKHVNDDEHVTCRCNILCFVVYNYGCDILWENGFCVIYICIYMKCLCRWNAKNKKKFKFLPLCRGQWRRPSAKKDPLPRAQAIALGKDFFKKILTISLPRAREQALGKGLKKFKKTISLPRADPRQRIFKKSWKFLCRGPGRRPTAKSKKKFQKNNFFAEGRPSA